MNSFGDRRPQKNQRDRVWILLFLNFPPQLRLAFAWGGPSPNLIGFVIKPKLGFDFKVGILEFLSADHVREQEEWSRHFVSVSF